MKIIRLLSFVSARTKMIRYGSSVSIYIVCIWLCLQVSVCSPILLSAAYLVCVSNFLLFVFWSTVSHITDNAKQFYTWHPQQLWTIPWCYKESTFNTFIIVVLLQASFSALVRFCRNSNPSLPNWFLMIGTFPSSLRSYASAWSTSVNSILKFNSSHTYKVLSHWILADSSLVQLVLVCGVLLGCFFLYLAGRCASHCSYYHGS